MMSQNVNGAIVWLITMFSALPPAMQMVIKLPAAEQRRNYRLIELTIPVRKAIVTAPARTPPP